MKKFEDVYRMFRLVTHLGYVFVGCMVVLWTIITFGVYVLPFSEQIFGLLYLVVIFGGIWGTVFVIVMTCIDTVIRILDKNIRLMYTPFVPWGMVCISTILAISQGILWLLMTEYSMSGLFVEYASNLTAATLFVIPIYFVFWLYGVIKRFFQKR